MVQYSSEVGQGHLLPCLCAYSICTQYRMSGEPFCYEGPLQLLFVKLLKILHFITENIYRTNLSNLMTGSSAFTRCLKSDGSDADADGATGSWFSKFG